MKQIQINKFIVPLNVREEFLKGLRMPRNLIKNLPGFIEDTVYEETAAEGDISYITVAVWENAEALDNAKKAASAEFQKQGFNPIESYKRLNIKIDAAVYKELDE